MKSQLVASTRTHLKDVTIILSSLFCSLDLVMHSGFWLYIFKMYNFYKTIIRQVSWICFVVPIRLVFILFYSNEDF